MNIRIVINDGWDVWKNFAIEEHMARNVKEDEIILYLWHCTKNVMLGKNQNPWRECNTKLLQEEGGKISRRITGGGAIYSDLGNMLFSFIVPKKLYDLDKQLSVILRACEMVGLNAKKSGRNDLTIDDKKFSGNAFFFNSKVGLHHGSLLINEDVENLVRYLTPSLAKITAKGISSVRSRVTNLSKHNHQITMENFKKTMIDAFTEIYTYDDQTVIYENNPDWFDHDEIMTIYNRNKSWDWCYGKSAEADVTLENRFTWGEVQLHIKLIKSKIEAVTIYSDSLDLDYIGNMAEIFTGIVFDRKILAEGVLNYGDTPERLAFSQDIAEWLLNEKF